MHRRSSLPILSLLLLMSCDHIYKEYHKESFSTLSWRHGEEISFYPEIEDVSKTYQLTLGVRHIYEARIKRIDVAVQIISPSKKTSVKQYGFNVMDDTGGYLASCAGNMCDLETVVDENLKFTEPGKYQFIVTQNGEQQRISGIMEFGLIIKDLQ